MTTVSKLARLKSQALDKKVNKGLISALEGENLNKYKNCWILTADRHLIGVGIEEGIVYTVDKKTKEHVAIDSLEPQFRSDFVCALWNRAKE